MPASIYPLLYQVNTRVWLRRLSAELGRSATLDDIPETDLDRLARLNFEWVYFLGVWQTGEAGRSLSRSNPAWLAEYKKVLPDVSEADICGSPFAVTGYRAHHDLGGDPALQRLHERLNRHGLRLMLDFVPNHTAPDHPWVYTNPEFYIAGSEAQFVQEPENYALVQTIHGEKILAHGRDPYFPGWIDTLQLNYANPQLQIAQQAELIKIAPFCDGLRCDMAMLILPEVFERTWGFPAQPFWSAAIAAVRQVSPGFTFMAEVYWDMEEKVLNQGFDYAYDKRLYDYLEQVDPAKIKEHLGATETSQRKSVRFLENHDEARAAAVFENERHQAAALITYLSPGLRFFHQGQLEGFRTKISVHLCRGPQESGDPTLTKFYSHLLNCLQLNVFHQGSWQLLSPQPGRENNSSHEACIAYAWTGELKERLLVVVNYAAPARPMCPGSAV